MVSCVSNCSSSENYLKFGNYETFTVPKSREIHLKSYLRDRSDFNTFVIGFIQTNDINPGPGEFYFDKLMNKMIFSEEDIGKTVKVKYKSKNSSMFLNSKG